MAFDHISGAEPSTVTFKLATISTTRNSSVMHQEIVSIGGTESSLAIGAVLNTTPASTAWALAVREVAPSTTVQVSSLGGAVIVRSSAANALVSVYQSTAADLNVTVAGYSTTANVSSVAGRVGTMPHSTLWGSCGGFHFDSSGALQITGTFSASTTVQVSSLGGTVTVAGNQSSNSSVYLPVRLTNGTSFLTANQDYTDGSTASNITAPTIVFDNGSNATMRAISLTQGLPVNVVAGSAASTTVNVSSLAGAVITRSSAANSLHTVYQSTAADLNVTVANFSTGTLSAIRDRDQSTQVVAIVNAVQPASTAYGMVVRLPAPFADSTNDAIKVNVVAGAAGGSTQITVYQSTVGALRAAVYQSTAADLNVTVAGYSTTVNVSSLAGAVIVRSSAANALVSVYQSTASELQVTATQNSTAWSVLARVTTSSGGGVEGSTTSPAHGVTGLHVRQVLSSLQSTTVLITSTHSTAVYDVISSVASVSHKVYAYMVTSTHTVPSTLVFMSSNAIDRWHVGFGSGSSGITGANMALSPGGGAFIFRTDAQNALRCRIEGGSSVTSTVIARISVSFFTE